MKKTILILSLALFSFTFANCLDAVFEFEQASIATYDQTFDGLILDSMYVDKGNANTRGNRLYIWKAYYKDGFIDSTYEGDYRDGTWDYRETKIAATYQVEHQENTWIFEGTTTDGLKDTMTIYFDGDSIATTSTDEGGTYTNIYVMKKDTLFRVSESEIIVLDEKDTNTCYVKNSRDDYNTIWYRYESSVQGKYVVLSITYIEEGLDRKVMTYYMLPRKGGSITAIPRKVRPAVNYKKGRPFDLLGRPAQGKYTVEFFR